MFPYQFIKPGILENSKVILKPLSLEDIDLLYPVAMEKELWQISLTRMESRNDLERYINEALAEEKKGISYPFTIIDKQSGKTAGSTRYGNITPAHSRLEIGWTWISTSFQGTGLNRACKYELLKYAFEILQANRVELKSDVLNTQSRNAMKKIGAKEEGILRSHMIAETGRVRDSVYYSILKQEWEEIKNTAFTAFK